MSFLPDRDRIISELCIPRDPGETRVVVAMSGGVDSSVVAGLLKYAGYDVVGVTLRLYPHADGDQLRKKSCCAGLDIGDASSVAAKLGIPHYVLDYEDRFRSAVVDHFVDSYIAGETPIPCVDCNRTVKFQDLLRVARDVGAHALATGHYVNSCLGSKGMEMYCALDSQQDQSYFLFATTSEQLDFIRFPLGKYSKEQTRAFASALGLSVSEKPSSQDICFVPSGRYSSLVEKLRPEAVQPGDIVHVDGRILGRHPGIVHFTVGQRRGLGLAEEGEALYVLRLDAQRQQVIVGPREALGAHRLRLRDVNWLGDVPLEEARVGQEPILVRLRSSGEFRLARFHRSSEDSRDLLIDLCETSDAVACGQACVFYSLCEQGTRVLGGGVIDKTWGKVDNLFAAEGAAFCAISG